MLSTEHQGRTWEQIKAGDQFAGPRQITYPGGEPSQAPYHHEITLPFDDEEDPDKQG